MPRRDTWLTSVLGVSLLVAVPVIAITGLLSNAAYDPRLGMNVLGQGRSLGPLDFYLFSWPTHPPWLYALTQGLHVSLGLAAIPIVLVKLWSVLGRTLAPAPRPTVAGALERLVAVLLVAAVLFEFATGVFELEYYAPFGVQLIAAHYYGAWVVIATFVLHAAIKLPTARRALALRRELMPLRASVASAPAAGRAVAAGPTMSRRALLATATVGSLVMLAQGVAQAAGGPVRRLGILVPRGETAGSGPNDFEVNGTLDDAGLTGHDIGAGWRLRLYASGADVRKLTRTQLLALPQRTYSLPIACREGWSTTQRWSGVRLRDLAALAGERGSTGLTIQALDGAGASLTADQVAADESLLALRVNGVDLSPDHGYPARVIVPAAIGVNCLKWVNSLSFDRSEV